MITKEQKEKIELENKKIADNISHVKHNIVVFSGKGGVGKTTVSVNLSYELHTHGYNTGILDADLAIIVTMPQQVSLIDSARAISMAKKMEIPHIALI
ncbi:MAG: P-loop NTPase [Bacteroidales bacterium]|nr:P-loop NTPase [Bacteroidales bacterium]